MATSARSPRSTLTCPRHARRRATVCRAERYSAGWVCRTVFPPTIVLAIIILACFRRQGEQGPVVGPPVVDPDDGRPHGGPSRAVRPKVVRVGPAVVPSRRTTRAGRALQLQRPAPARSRGQSGVAVPASRRPSGLGEPPSARDRLRRPATDLPHPDPSSARRGTGRPS